MLVGTKIDPLTLQQNQLKEIKLTNIAIYFRVGFY